MYLDYATYQTMGGTLTEAEFSSANGICQSYLDLWTLNRVDAAAVPQSVLDSLYEMIGAYVSGASNVLTSYSNGVDSFGFSAGGDTSLPSADLRHLHGIVVRRLPVSLCSASTDGSEEF